MSEKKAVKKTYILMVARVFPVTHPRKGEPTNFIEKIQNGEKIHTIRGNYPWWKKRIDNIIAGKAVLSIRVWTGKPYRSPQKEIAVLTKVGLEYIEIIKTTTKERCGINSTQEPETAYKNSPLLFDVAKNDSLEYKDFIKWFFPRKIKRYQMQAIAGAIIHFTDFRYSPEIKK